MASTPQFASTVNVNSGLVPATLDVSLTAPTNVTTVFTAGASGSKVEEIVCQAVGTTVLGVVNIFRFDGATYHLIDQFLIPVATSSTTVAANRQNRVYENLMLKSGDTIRITNTIAGNQSLIKVTCFGGDF